MAEYILKFEVQMQISRLGFGFIITISAILVLAGSIYLLRQHEQSNESTFTPIPTPTTNPATQFNATGPAISSIPNTTHLGNITLVCVGSLSYAVPAETGAPALAIDSLNITNYGTANATVWAIEIQTYFPNGTQALNLSHQLDSSRMYNLFPPWYPYTIMPNQTVYISSNGRPGSYISDQLISAVTSQNPLASYKITPSISAKAT